MRGRSDFSPGVYDAAVLAVAADAARDALRKFAGEMRAHKFVSGEAGVAMARQVRAAMERVDRMEGKAEEAMEAVSDPDEFLDACDAVRENREIDRQRKAARKKNPGPSGPTAAQIKDLELKTQSLRRQLADPRGDPERWLRCARNLQLTAEGLGLPVPPEVAEAERASSRHPSSPTSGS